MSQNECTKLIRMQSKFGLMFPRGIALTWNITKINPKCAPVGSCHLLCYENPNNKLIWKKTGEIKALPFPLTCTLSVFSFWQILFCYPIKRYFWLVWTILWYKIYPWVFWKSYLKEKCSIIVYYTTFFSYLSCLFTISL